MNKHNFQEYLSDIVHTICRFNFPVRLQINVYRAITLLGTFIIVGCSTPKPEELLVLRTQPLMEEHYKQLNKLQRNLNRGRFSPVVHADVLETISISMRNSTNEVRYQEFATHCNHVLEADWKPHRSWSKKETSLEDLKDDNRARTLAAWRSSSELGKEPTRYAAVKALSQPDKNSKDFLLMCASIVFEDSSTVLSDPAGVVDLYSGLPVILSWMNNLPEIQRGYRHGEMPITKEDIVEESVLTKQERHAYAEAYVSMIRNAARQRSILDELLRPAEQEVRLLALEDCAFALKADLLSPADCTSLYEMLAGLVIHDLDPLIRDQARQLLIEKPSILATQFVSDSIPLRDLFTAHSLLPSLSEQKQLDIRSAMADCLYASMHEQSAPYNQVAGLVGREPFLVLDALCRTSADEYSSMSRDHLGLLLSASYTLLEDEIISEKHRELLDLLLDLVLPLKEYADQEIAWNLHCLLSRYDPAGLRILVSALINDKDPGSVIVRSAVQLSMEASPQQQELRASLARILIGDDEARAMEAALALAGKGEIISKCWADCNPNDSAQYVALARLYNWHGESEYFGDEFKAAMVPLIAPLVEHSDFSMCQLAVTILSDWSEKDSQAWKESYAPMILARWPGMEEFIQ